VQILSEVCKEMNIVRAITELINIICDNVEDDTEEKV
jgi:hypothetical protein